MTKNEVAVVGWHEGSAGQIHSWFEEAGFGKIVYFIHPDDKPPEIIKVQRAISQFSYPEKESFKNTPFICKSNWVEFLIQKGISKVLVTIADSNLRWIEMEKAVNAGLELINAIHPTSLLLFECILFQYSVKIFKRSWKAFFNIPFHFR